MYADSRRSTNRIAVFRQAETALVALRARYPEVPVLGSIARQLDYLIGLETGTIGDRGRLRQIVLGVQAAREVEPLDLGVADVLHRVAAEVRRMQAEADIGG